MPRFAILTPTIPERTKELDRCTQSIVRGWSQDYHHYICGDGFVPEQRWHKTTVMGTPERGYDWGNNVRNYLLEQDIDSEYILFLDDDNTLLANGLVKLAAYNTDLITCQLQLITEGISFALPDKPVREVTEKTRLCTQCFCIRTKIAKQIRWGKGTGAEFDYFQSAYKLTKDVSFCNEIITTWLQKKILLNGQWV